MNVGRERYRGAMCGRYANARSAAELSAFFEAYDETGGELAAAYNIAPTDPVAVVRADAVRRLSMASWGLPRPWDRRSRQVMINARSETVATSRVFSAAFAGRRCLIPADGWYEWVPGPGKIRRPYYMTSRDGAPLAFAGLWNPVDGEGAACAVITTAAAGELAAIHDRMPLVLPETVWRRWLDSGEPAADLLAGPAPEWTTGIEIRPVGRAVGDVRNDGPDLIARSIPSSTAGPAEMTLF